jgi:hypothetical protein
MKRTTEEYLELVNNVYLDIDALKFRNPDMERRYKSDLSRDEYELKMKSLIVDDMAEVDDHGYFELKPIETDNNTPISGRALKKIQIADAWNIDIDVDVLDIPDPYMEHLVRFGTAPDEALQMVKIMLMDGCVIKEGCLLRGESSRIIAESTEPQSTQWQ